MVEQADRENWTCGTVGQRRPDQGRAHARADPRYRLRMRLSRRALPRPRSRNWSRRRASPRAAFSIISATRTTWRGSCSTASSPRTKASSTRSRSGRASCSDDPLQSFLIFLNLYAQMMDDMETLHPGCMVAIDHLPGADVRRRGPADERRLFAADAASASPIGSSRSRPGTRRRTRSISTAWPTI